ncbi:hypothetical protein SAMN07250955_106271 [Arboricoccus pini]|uniref:Uncharacterized protein n=1 Tax=Arboricoccus pini TaxID=1963835 RepID=A0A212RAA7_9PROT|nr:hypothetical protein [Arboricoccus pini]SNB68988.1 hypothetical protein SAMN07250955_106271 [Arboricoccus pini]
MSNSPLSSTADRHHLAIVLPSDVEGRWPVIATVAFAGAASACLWSILGTAAYALIF